MATIKMMKALYARDYPDRAGDKRTFWHELGVAYVRDDGKIDIVLHIVPPPNNKQEYRVLLRDMDDAQQQRGDRGGFGGDSRGQQHGGGHGYGGQRGGSSHGERPPRQDYPSGGGPSDPEDEIPF